MVHSCEAIAESAPESIDPIVLGIGPHLFLDDYLIESSSFVVRRIMSPKRESANPLISGEEDGNFQPYISVLRDPETKRFRIWYNIQVDGRRQSHLGYMESNDGVHWIRPHMELSFPFTVTYGASIIDEGLDYLQSEKRYKYAYYHDGGVRVAVSSDGLDWDSLSPDILVSSGDFVNIYRDPIRNRYGLNFKSYIEPRDWLNSNLRTCSQSNSEDLLSWLDSDMHIYPDKRDYGETQFYCMGGVLARGDLLIGMVKVLREDHPAEPYGEIRGIGYTTLVWSRDGKTWVRDREPFLNRSSQPGTWDRAMSWVDTQLPVDDEVYLYYGGYRYGHKGDRNRDRQIGLARIGRDRYVARESDTHHEGSGDTARLLTPALIFEGIRMTLNVNADNGKIFVQVMDQDGEPIPGFTFSDFDPITIDSIEAPVRWARPLADLEGLPVRLEFQMHQSVQLFAFNLYDNE